MLKKLLLIPLLLTFFISYELEAKNKTNKLLQCLAKEEEFLMKTKAELPFGKLNQELVNELAGSNDIMLKSHYVNEICNNVLYHPSVNLLRMLLLKEKEIYDLNFEGIEDNLKPFKLGYIYEFQKQVPRIFTQFISSLNAEMPDAHCLEKSIPEIKVFNEKLKYLETEITTKELVKNKKEIEAIFLKLRKFKSIKQKCQRQVDAKLEKIKKFNNQ